MVLRLAFRAWATRFAPAASPPSSLDGGGRLCGVYEHYLLLRPYPSLKVLFASPSLRVPGMLQSNFLARVGGSSRVRDAIEQAFADGSGVTAKVRWTTRADPDGRLEHLLLARRRPLAGPDTPPPGIEAPRVQWRLGSPESGRSRVAC